MCKHVRFEGVEPFLILGVSHSRAGDTGMQVPLESQKACYYHFEMETYSFHNWVGWRLL